MIDRLSLVALYDIRPGNGAGLFLQPRSPLGVYEWLSTAHLNQLPYHSITEIIMTSLLSLLLNESQN